MNEQKGYFGLGPLQNFRSGWALFPFVGVSGGDRPQRAHYWREDKKTMPPRISDGGRVRYFTSLCHVSSVTNDKVPALGVGNFPQCLRCARALKVMNTYRRATP